MKTATNIAGYRVQIVCVPKRTLNEKKTKDLEICNSKNLSKT